MKKLSVSTIKERNALVATLCEQYELLDTAIETFNSGMQDLWEQLEPVVDSCNQAITEMREWKDTVVQQMEDYYRERSEKWQDSDAGSNYQEWKQQFEGIDFEDVNITMPNTVEMDIDTSNVDQIMDVEEEPVS
jgi:hypothetical protein